MFIPISTDAPVYHWPWVTLSLIVGNVAAFTLNAAGLLPGGGEQWQTWALHFGTGLHPLEWISSHFVHFGWIHLLGNMVFLWVFGLVVEGKIGWRRYLLVYFGIGICQAFLVQTLMLVSNDPRPAGGASGVIYGLMAISLVWAPKNEVSIVGFIWLLWGRVFYFDMTILSLALFYFVMQLLIAGLTGFAMGSEILHLTGAAVGLGVGLLMLHRNWVDCENWDLFAVMRGTYGSTAVADEMTFRNEAVAEKMREGAGRSSSTTQAQVKIPKPHLAVTAVEQMRFSLQRGKPAAALAEYRRALEFDPNHIFTAADRRSLIDVMGKAEMWNEVGPLMEQYVDDYPDDVPMRLQLAAVLAEVEQRPRQALRVLDELPTGELDERQNRRRERIETQAQQLIDEGVMELQGRRWN